MSIELARDVMQVCLGGHVITDVLASYPEQGVRNCIYCGAPTISRCPTCGEEIPGAAPLPGMVTIGHRVAPQHCPRCGAAFPWAGIPMPGDTPDTLLKLESLLRRLPHAIRQLRERHGSRPTLRVQDEHDLEDLLRVVLHLHFDDVRRECRTPSHAERTRTDFIVGPERVAVTVKLVQTAGCERSLLKALHEDCAYYARRAGCGGIIALIYDPERRLCSARRFEAACNRAGDGRDRRCVVAS
jgi:hypothetical protein